MIRREAYLCQNSKRQNNDPSPPARIHEQRMKAPNGNKKRKVKTKGKGKSNNQNNAAPPAAPTTAPEV